MRFSFLLLLSLLLVQCSNKLSNNAPVTNEDCVCMEIYQPVCGADGKEYSNSCYAQCAGVSFTEGTCSKKATGRIQYLGDPKVDGCDWVVVLDVEGTPTNFRPTQLAAAFKKEGLAVAITYKTTLERSPCGRGGQIAAIEIVDIREK